MAKTNGQNALDGWSCKIPMDKMLSTARIVKIQWQNALDDRGGENFNGKELSPGREKEILLAICYLGRDVACYVCTGAT
ncbi:hypothetical protein DF185_03155 [Marinifilum breve]|uniref:Uncharacterized protein n=1 Tax=Marinifilum breve TaxID=2184082 RepID=A0A2V4A380_9BACT|nr:hypothetical protein DF185_03155 [Marinifilum breve]